VELSDNPALFILDAGSGIRELGLWLLRERRLPIKSHLLLTHTHWDHIQGFPFFAPAFIPGNEITLHGPAHAGSSLEEALEGQMLSRYFPVSLDQLGARLGFQHLEGQTHSELAGVQVETADLHHTATTIGYRLSWGEYVLAYVTDTEPLSGLDDPSPDPAVLRLAQGADLLIHDTQYTDEEYTMKLGWGHAPLGYVVRLAAAAGVRRLALFHHDPPHDDDILDSMVEQARTVAARLGARLEVFAAAEQQVVYLGG